MSNNLALRWKNWGIHSDMKDIHSSWGHSEFSSIFTMSCWSNDSFIQPCAEPLSIIGWYYIPILLGFSCNYAILVEFIPDEYPATVYKFLRWWPALVFPYLWLTSITDPVISYFLLRRIIKNYCYYYPFNLTKLLTMPPTNFEKFCTINVIKVGWM